MDPDRGQQRRSASGNEEEDMEYYPEDLLKPAQFVASVPKEWVPAPVKLTETFAGLDVERAKDEADDSDGSEQPAAKKIKKRCPRRKRANRPQTDTRAEPPEVNWDEWLLPVSQGDKETAAPSMISNPWDTSLSDQEQMSAFSEHASTLYPRIKVALEDYQEMAKRSYKSDVHKRKASEIFDSVIRDVTPVMRGLRELTTQLTGTDVNPDSSTRIKSYAAGADTRKLFSELSVDEQSFLMHSAKLGNAYTRMLQPTADAKEWQAARSRSSAGVLSLAVNNDLVEYPLARLRDASAEQGHIDPEVKRKYLERLEELSQMLESGVATFETMRKSCASLRPDGDLVTKTCPNLPLDLAQDLTDPSGCKCSVFTDSMCSVSLRESAYPVMLNAQRMRTSIQGELDALRGASSASTTTST